MSQVKFGNELQPRNSKQLHMGSAPFIGQVVSHDSIAPMPEMVQHSRRDDGLVPLTKLPNAAVKVPSSLVDAVGITKKFKGTYTSVMTSEGPIQLPNMVAPEESIASVETLNFLMQRYDEFDTQQAPRRYHEH